MKNNLIEDLLHLKISSLVKLTENIISVELISVEGLSLPKFEPGAHIDVHITNSITRQYSLCNRHENTSCYRLAILKEKRSRGGSETIFKNFKVGQIVTTSYPKCNFKLVNNSKNNYLFAGGIGITPLLSMAYYLDHTSTDFELHYFSRSLNETAFADEIKKSSLSKNTFFYFDDDDEKKFNTNFFKYKLNSNSNIYLCGPLGFMDYITSEAMIYGWSNKQIHIERFSQDFSKRGNSFEVFLYKSGKKIIVPDNTSIAEILINEGINVNLSCQQGVCGTCLTPVIEGIPDHKDLYQSEEEKELNNFIALCCSRSKSSQLILDI
jgi:vanillate O-demethylase ferredoxin subunit